MMSRRDIKRNILRLEKIESEMLTMLATIPDLSDEESKVLVKEILNAVHYRSRFIEALEKLDKEGK